MLSIEVKTFLHSTLHIIEQILKDVESYLLDASDNCCL